jgi:hypothetical protein
MSKSLNQTVKFWKDLELLVRGKVNFSKICTDVDTYAHALILNCIIVEESLADVSVAAYRRLIKPWLITAAEVGPEVHSKECKVVYSELTKIERRESGLAFPNGDALYKSFKHSISDRVEQPGLLLAPVKELVISVLKYRDATAFKTLSQLFTGIGRVDYRTFDYSKQSLDLYLANEEKLKSLELDPRFVKSINSIIRSWEKQLPFDLSVNPRFSSGAVAQHGKLPILKKYSDGAWDRMLAYSYGEPEVPTSKLLNRTCEVLFVPKTATTWRTISMEPSTLAFYQQSVLRSLSEWFRHHPYLKNIIKLNDDGRQNRVAARLGSLGTDVEKWKNSTIDLSSASDLVSWELVKGAFRGTQLLRYLFATRSTHALLPDGTILSLRKFAPMGSAVCFPVECIIFAAITEFVSRVCGNRDTKNFLVYGDDIICHNSLAGNVIVALEACGFEINLSKTFTGTSQAFRESCGGEYLDGVDVTPLRLSRRYVYHTMKQLIANPDAYSRGITFINVLRERNLKVARAFELSAYLELPSKYQPLFTTDGSHGSVMSDTPTNHNLRYQPDYELFGISYRHGGVVNRSPNEQEPEHHNHHILYEWLRSTNERNEVIEPFRVQRYRTTTKVVAKSTTIT